MKTDHTSHPAASPREALRHAVDHAAHYLPAQGPIGVFIHHNTLHAFQQLKFDEAVVMAAREFGAEPYMKEEAYQKDRARGRIADDDVRVVVRAEPDGVIIPGRLTRHELRTAMLAPGVREAEARTLRWHLEEGGWLTSFRGDLGVAAKAGLAGDNPRALWEACVRRMPAAVAGEAVRVKRPAEAVMITEGLNMDDYVHPPLIRLTGAYVDQGIAYWPMPLRELGLLRAARRIMGQGMSLFPANLEGVGKMFRAHEAEGLDAEDVVLRMLGELGVPQEEWEDYLVAELLPLAGWAGLIRKLEEDPSLAPHDRVRCSLLEFLALRLCYTVTALRNLAGESRSWREVRKSGMREAEVGVAAMFDVAQLIGMGSEELLGLPLVSFEALRREVAAFGSLERRRLLHLAYERRHERQILVPLARHRRMPRLVPESRRLAAQVMFCIDEREESIRRALEEVDPEIETLGAAGFFGCAIDYAGIDDAGGVALCPVVVKPGHEVREVPVGEHAGMQEKRQALRRVWAKVAQNSYVSSRSLVRGWVSTACLGFLSIFPLTLRVLRPSVYARFMERMNRLFLPEPRTELAFMSDDEASREATSGLLSGFCTPEKVERVAGVLGPAGLHAGMARVVAVLGHGSTTLNNPHESAYNCGACGGRSGAPNARLFAAMANRPAVREGLRAKGITVPEDTWFVGGYHDTCSDAIQWFDLDLVPEGHRGDLARLQASLDKARAMSAHERTRRFEAASPDFGPEEALVHVRERSEHLGEPRPEYGHGTNAVCIVGRREQTRGLFFDRRAFLVSYDATLDPKDEALARVLGAVIPVCGGISLEYYFSFVDNEVYGCGTKLPHNVTGLVGVMNGYQGDLRTGLPLQTVEIHEPVRILFVVETTPERLMKVVRANPELTQFVENQWIRVATMDPGDGAIQVLRADGTFEPLTGDDEPLPQAATSRDYYRGRMEHLPVARIGAA
ncbi:MAG: hypothetical protein DVB22_001745 [Verrucomicrobia bacterium]|nr:MAG: hypothetical protein DVB22_001745 [Verrucomicrobiota bacterium]